ncbi:hypothetical protein EDB83DRAFT_2515763 [Lactarius deliciosus]|nr:hypothetical protein EDB83DRAFT_2515763 [Lactarius deliciosus]
MRPFLQKENERRKQEATNQEHERERERLEQEAVVNQEHERERLARHHQEHKADDLDRQNQEAANEEREQRRQTQQITKSFQSFASSHGILANVSASFCNLRQEKQLRLENRNRHPAEAPSGQPEPHQSPEHMDMIIEEPSDQPEPFQPPENMDMDLNKGPSGQPEVHPSLFLYLDEGPSGQPEPSRPSDNADTDPHLGPSGQPEPPGPPNPSGGVTDSSHRNASSAGLCPDHLSELSAAIERNTKTVELVLSQVLHLQRRANTSSTHKDQDEDLDKDLLISDPCAPSGSYGHADNGLL